MQLVLIPLLKHRMKLIVHRSLSVRVHLWSLRRSGDLKEITDVLIDINNRKAAEISGFSVIDLIYSWGFAASSIARIAATFTENKL